MHQFVFLQKPKWISCTSIITADYTFPRLVEILMSDFAYVKSADNRLNIREHAVMRENFYNISRMGKTRGSNSDLIPKDTVFGFVVLRSSATQNKNTSFTMEL